jgi:transposase InsO family protein
VILDIFSRRVVGWCMADAETATLFKLKGYAQNNCNAITNYHRRYHGKQPVSSSRADGCVDEIANARMGKKQRMRWSPRGAHRVALVRAAVLDGRFKSCGVIPLAA